MRVLICGDRYWTDFKAIERELTKLDNVTCVIEGEARGADTLARTIANKLGISVLAFPANWTKYGRAAGQIRNQQMLKEGQPDIVLAFHSNIENSKGTKNMLLEAKKANIPYILFSS